ncbi:MAG: hypothetical protein ACFCVK_09270 [Acidimicrobiales bacterium]
MWKAIEEFTGLLADREARTYLQLADAVAGYVGRRSVIPFRHVVVDEGQDLHEAQWRHIAGRRAPGGAGRCAAGAVRCRALVPSVVGVEFVVATDSRNAHAGVGVSIAWHPWQAGNGAPQRTTTNLWLPSELWDEIAGIAEQRGTTMLEVVADAVHRLGREE